MSRFVLMLCVLVSGCDSAPPLVAMSAEKMAERIAECEKFGLRAATYISPLTYKIVDIQCQPKYVRIEP